MAYRQPYWPATVATRDRRLRWRRQHRDAICLDGGLVSNSPLGQVVEIGGLTDKNVYVVNLWLEKRALPRPIPQVLARRDEIVFAEK
jgi:hypothetical protein